MSALWGLMSGKKTPFPWTNSASRLIFAGIREPHFWWSPQQLTKTRHVLFLPMHKTHINHTYKHLWLAYVLSLQGYKQYVIWTFCHTCYDINVISVWAYCQMHPVLLQTKLYNWNQNGCLYMHVRYRSFSRKNKPEQRKKLTGNISFLFYC